MGLNVKEHLKLSVIYSVVAAVPSVLQVLVQPFIEGDTRLKAVDFANIGIAEMITSLAFTIVLFSMGNAISRFYYDYTDDRKGYHRMVSSVYSSMLLRGIGLLFIAFLLKNYIGHIFQQPDLQNFSSYGFAAIIVGINRSVYITAAALYRNEKRITAFVLVNVGMAILRTMFQLFGLFFFKMSFLGYVYGSAIGGSLVSVSILIYSYRQSGIKFDRKLLRSMNQFAMPLFQYGLLAWGLTFYDKFIMEKYPTNLGIYFTAVNFALGMQLIIQGIQGATQPEIFRYMKEGIANREKEIKSLSNMLMAQTQVLIALMIIPVMLFLNLFYETDVRMAYALIPIIFIRYIPKNQYVIFSFTVYYLKKTRFFLYLNILTLAINILLNNLLIPRYMIYGAIISLMVSDVLQVLITYFYSQRIQHISWNLSKLVYGPLLGVSLVIIISYFTQKMNGSPFVTGLLSVGALLSITVFLYRTEVLSYFQKRIKLYR